MSFFRNVFGCHNLSPNQSKVKICCRFCSSLIVLYQGVSFDSFKMFPSEFVTREIRQPFPTRKNILAGVSIVFLVWQGLIRKTRLLSRRCLKRPTIGECRRTLALNPRTVKPSKNLNITYHT